MKILVAIKRVIDPYVKIRIKSDYSGVETQNVKMSINPFDEIAVEEALRLKEKNVAEEIVVVSIGDIQVQETLRHALALGADRAIHIHAQQNFCSLNIAKILQAIVKQENPGLVLLGKQAIDSDNNQTAQMLAGLLNWPQATFAYTIEMENKIIRVTREIDGGLETLALQLPAIVSTDLRLNEPRYASLPNIMKAKRKPLDVMAVEQLGIDLKEHQNIISVTPPQARQAGSKVSSVKELLDKLQHEAKII